MWYDVALDDAVHDTVILLDDMALAVTPVGVPGGDSVVGGDCVLADAGGLDIVELPPAFSALIS
jgi:hypothetical protein